MKKLFSARRGNMQCCQLKFKLSRFMNDFPFINYIKFQSP